MAEKRYIECEKVIDELIRFGMTEDGEAIIRNIPDADVEPVVRGTWIWKHRHRGGVRYMTGEDQFGNVHTIQVNMTYECDDPYCSECGKLCDNSGSLNYCPNCGARCDL